MKHVVKRIVSLFIAIIFTAVISVPAFAKTGSNNGVVTVGEINSLNNSRTTISDIMTFDQIANHIAKDKDVPIAKVKNDLNRNILQRSNLTAASSVSAKYRVISTYVTVTSEYEVKLNFYCETSEGDYFHGIVKILDVSINRSYTNYRTGTTITKQFSGSLYTNLEDANRIYYILNGDFYNNGTTSAGGGVEIGIGSSAKISFSVSYASNYYSYCYEDGRVRF